MREKMRVPLPSAIVHSLHIRVICGGGTGTFSARPLICPSPPPSPPADTLAKDGQRQGQGESEGRSKGQGSGEGRRRKEGALPWIQA